MKKFLVKLASILVGFAGALVLIYFLLFLVTSATSIPSAPLVSIGVLLGSLIIGFGLLKGARMVWNLPSDWA